MRTRNLHIFLLLVWCSSLASCKWFAKEEVTDDVVLARVYDEYLFYSEVEELVRVANSPEDSAQLVKKYVDNWVKRNLIAKQAEKYLPEEQDDIEKQVRDYRLSLMVYLYESELIKQKLDTVVEMEEVVKYYEEYRPSFELRDDILQFHYIKVSNEAPKLNLARKWLDSDVEEDRMKLTDYCFQYADDFSLSDTLWFEKPMVMREIPMEEDALKQYIQSHDLAEVEDSNFVYLLKINDYKRKGELAPLNYLIDDISKLIINKRKIVVVNSAYESIYEDGVNAGSFEIYTQDL